MRYDHHPDPVIAYCIECDVIEGMFYDVRVGLMDRDELASRVDRAMDFRVGGDADAIKAKDRVREIDAALRGRKSYAETQTI